MTGGRRRADERRGPAAPVQQTAGEPATDVQPHSPAPDTDASLTMPRTTRADRRREGLLPPGEDPLVRRPPARPAGGPPPGAGRRRTDLDPTAAPGLPPQGIERRQFAAAPPVAAPPVAAPPVAAPPAAGGEPTAFHPVPFRPSPAPAASGPITVAPATSATGIPAPPAGRRNGAADPATGPDAAPRTTGMPTWAAEPGPPAPAPDVTQRVTLAAPAESAWGSSVPAADPTRAVQLPARPAPAAERPEPAEEPARRPELVPVGGRAAARLERQAAEEARKKSGRQPARSGSSARTRPGRDEALVDPPRPAPRRVVQGLVAVVVVAVAVLGFWSFTSPQTNETSAQTPATTGAPSPSAAGVPAQESITPSAEVVLTPVGPVRAPITVLNSTGINGLAADVGDAFTAAGWDVTGTGASPVEDVATTTVYYTEGDSVQQQAATQLVEQFPEVSGPAPRFFELDEGSPAALVVVTTGNWRP